MNASRTPASAPYRIAPLVLSVAVAALIATGCKKKEEDPATAPPAASTASEPAPAVVPQAAPDAAPAPQVSVTSVTLGTETGPDLKIVAPKTSFAPKDKVIASVVTSAGDPSLALSGKLTAKWTYQDGQVVSEEPKVLNFTGQGVSAFEISMPDGLPAGNYTLEILLNDKVAQTTTFTVQ